MVRITMTKLFRFPALALAAASLLLAACVSAPAGGRASSGLSPKVAALVDEAVFEVVVRKAAADSLTYHKPLDWSAVPYAIRTDEYYSIGTAFAVSRTDLVTAFHVIDLGEASLVYDAYYIRDSRGGVYEVDAVKRGSNERDFLVFTVKDRTFERYFEFQKDVSTGAQVYSVGNALGEGIVVRNGLILGTLPEEESGRWQRLKSSADGNPGNSGGPLITPDGKVVGVVAALKDNILYSLPVSALLEVPPETLKFRQRLTYGHLLLANTLTRVYETEVALPAPYREVRKTVTDRYAPVYDQTMKELFKAAPAYLDGPANAYFLSAVADSSFPELAFVDKDDNQWKMSDLKVERFNLPDDGAVFQAKVGGYSFLKVELPKTAALDSVLKDPKTLMDLVLKGVSLERSLGGSEKYRILSFGKPVETGEYRDMVGRTWLRARWTVEFEDRALIAYALPLPDGPAVVWTYQPTGRIGVYDWDLRAVCDRVQTGYKGTFPEWERFLGLGGLLPELFSGVRFRWSEPDRSVELTAPDFALSADARSFEWTPASSLFLSPAYYFQGGKVRFGFRKLLIQRDVRGRDFAILYKNVKPDARLGAKAAEGWDALVKARAPFDGKPGINPKDNVGALGAILPQREPAPDALYSLYLSMEEPGGEEALAARFEALRSGIGIVR
jgi:hypothetical protein